jgi:uncharacterized protein YifE (UPF0438 family)
LSSLSKWDVRLLNKHLTRYKKLESGQVEPSSANERHFIDVFVNGQPPITQHEIAYSRYKAEQLTTETFKASTAAEHINDDDIEENETTVDTLDEVLISAEQASEKFSLASRLRKHYQTKLPSKDDLSANAMVWMNFLTESSVSKSLERWSADTFNTLSNEYTKIIDGSFADGLKSGADYVSPALHRLVDGHTLPEAFRRGREAMQNDSTIQEVYGTLEALLSDMSSVIGLPVVEFGKEKAEAFRDAFAAIGVDEKRFADFFSYNTVEVIGSAIPALALMFSWNSDDTERFAKIVGALAISTAYAGNPIGAIVVLVGLAKSFQKRRQENLSVTTWAKSLGSGGLTSTLVIVSMSLVGPTLWVFGISVLIAFNLMKAKGVDVSWSRATQYFLDWLRKNSPANAK